MKRFSIIGLTILLSCGGSLSEDQRKKLHDGMENQKIIKLSDAEIVTASLEEGRAIFSALEQTRFSPEKTDSIARARHARIRWIVPGSPDALEVESQLIEAYVIGAETGATQDNIQKLRKSPEAEDYDSLLYSRPVVTPLPDGVVNVEGVWNIYLAKKEVIRSVSKEK